MTEVLCRLFLSRFVCWILSTAEQMEDDKRSFVLEMYFVSDGVYGRRNGRALGMLRRSRIPHEGKYFLILKCSV